MNISLTFTRIFFLLVSTLLLTTYAINMIPGGFTLTNTIIGIASGLILGLAFIGTDVLLKQFSLRSFNIAMLGLLFGYLMGQAIMFISNAVIDFNALQIEPANAILYKAVIYLFCAYLGMTMTLRAADEVHLSIPFIKLKASSQKKKDLLVDASILLDPRIIDLATSGLLDNLLVVPRFALKDLNNQSETGDESSRARARRSLEVFKKLEGITTLDLRYSDNDFPEVKDPTAKLIQLARTLDANIITADMSRIQQSAYDGIRIINIHSLSNALKPLTHAGEYLTIKIQRYGKEPRQGVGYLEDGTMVVVNGGAEFIGETIRTQVLSVKHTSSGRMIFCNATDELMPDEDNLGNLAAPAIDNSSPHKNYFAL